MGEKTIEKLRIPQNTGDKGERKVAAVVWVSMYPRVPNKVFTGFWDHTLLRMTIKFDLGKP